jgi:DNA modification methylase
MKNTAIKPGDRFRLGTHLLACGDATNPLFVNAVLGNSRISLVLTDPPYGVAYVEGREGFLKSKTKHAAIKNDHLQSDSEYLVFTRRWIEAVKPFLTRKNALYVFNSDKMLFPLKLGMQEAGCHFAQLLVWVKTQAVVGRMDYLCQHELIAYGWIGRHEFRRSKDKSVLIYPKPSKSTLHPTMKPVGLLRQLVLNSSKIGDIIFDPFGGSGSTLIAAEQTKRQCITLELDPHYCAVIIERFRKVTGTEPEKLPPLIYAA